MTPHERLLQLDPYIPVSIISHDYPGIYGVCVRYSFMVEHDGIEAAQRNEEVARLLAALDGAEPHTFQRGDHVYIGGGEVHWILDFIDPRFADPLCTLVSGLSGRRQYNVPLSTLTLHTPAAQEGALT